jgi:hypothetical protein
MILAKNGATKLSEPSILKLQSTTQSSEIGDAKFLHNIGNEL